MLSRAPRDWGVLEGIYQMDPSPGAQLPIWAHLGGGEGLRPTLLGTLEAHLGASDPLRGGEGLRLTPDMVT